MNAQEAKAFAEKHITVWNRHNLDEIVNLYTTDVELYSPLAVKVVGSAMVKGRDALRPYFGAALAKYPDLQFKLVNTLLCVDSVTLYFKSISDQLVAEVLFLEPSGKIKKVFAHYAC